MVEEESLYNGSDIPDSNMVKKLEDYSPEELEAAKKLAKNKAKEDAKQNIIDSKIKLKEDKKKLKEDKRELAKKRLQSKREDSAKGKKIKVIVGDKEYEVPESQIFDLSKKEYKIKEDIKKISNAEVVVLYLRDSGIGEFKYVKPNNGMFIVEGRYYHINHSCIYNIGKKRIPLAVIPEWSFIPLSKKEYEIILGAKYQDAQMLIIKSLENAEVVKINQDVTPTKKGDPKLIGWILVAAVVGVYFLSKTFGTG